MIVFRYQNIDEITINLYEIDQEILFSRSPFLEEEKNTFSYVKPNYSEKLKIEKSPELKILKYSIPSDVLKFNKTQILNIFLINFYLNKNLLNTAFVCIQAKLQTDYANKNLFIEMRTIN